MDIIDNEKWPAFFRENYSSLPIGYNKVGKYITLGNKNDKTCRFCEKRYPEVFFKKMAHAIPESIGNKDIISYYECDNCNSFFSKMFENDFINYLGLHRVISSIKGKNGFIKKKSPLKKSEIIDNGPILNILNNENDPIVKIDLQKKVLILQDYKEPFTPIAVYKCLTKIALTLIPENEYKNFELTKRWIMENDHSSSEFKFNKLEIFYSYLQPPCSCKRLEVGLLRRKENNNALVPYLSLILRICNHQFQIYVPGCKEDKLSTNSSYATEPFPFYNAVVYKKKEFSSRTKIKGYTEEIVVIFDSYRIDEL
jgi:hypothetical protein